VEIEEAEVNLEEEEEETEGEEVETEEEEDLIEEEEVEVEEEMENIDHDQELHINKMRMETKLLKVKDNKDNLSEENQDKKIIHLTEEMALEEEEEVFQKMDMEKETGDLTEMPSKKLLLMEFKLKEQQKKVKLGENQLQQKKKKKNKKKENLEEKKKL
jgi:hypothetical protein